MFEEIGRRGRLGRVMAVKTLPDPREGLDYLIEIMCDFWSIGPTVERLYDAMVLDPEFAQALTERNERRRQHIEALVSRIAARATHLQVRRDTVDLIFALTSLAMFRMLARERSPKAVGALIRAFVHAALDQLDS